MDRAGDAAHANGAAPVPRLPRWPTLPHSSHMVAPTQRAHAATAGLPHSMTASAPTAHAGLSYVPHVAPADFAGTVLGSLSPEAAPTWMPGRGRHPVARHGSVGVGPSTHLYRAALPSTLPLFGGGVRDMRAVAGSAGTFVDPVLGGVGRASHAHSGVVYRSLAAHQPLAATAGLHAAYTQPQPWLASYQGPSSIEASLTAPVHSSQAMHSYVASSRACSAGFAALSGAPAPLAAGRDHHAGMSIGDVAVPPVPSTSGVARVLGCVLHDAACPQFQAALHSHNHSTVASECPPHVVVAHVADALQRLGHVTVVHERNASGAAVPVHRVRCTLVVPLRSLRAPPHPRGPHVS